LFTPFLSSLELVFSLFPLWKQTQVRFAALSFCRNQGFSFACYKFSRSFGLATTRRVFQVHARKLVVRSLETTISTTTEFRWTAVCSRMPYPTCFRSFACAAASQGGGNSGRHNDG
jgi:hypothetical protein